MYCLYQNDFSIAMYAYKDVTIPLWLVIAAIVLPNLLPDPAILGTIMPSILKYKWAIPTIKMSIGIIIVMVPYSIHKRYIHKRNIDDLSQFKVDTPGANPFKNRHEFMLWSDNVLLRLKFDEKLYDMFKKSSERTISLYRLGYSDPIESVNESINILNQALLLKEKQKIKQ